MDQDRESISLGSKVAFEQMFRSNYTRLCIYAESLLHDREVVEDLVQGAFCELWEKRDKLKIHDSLNAYLYRAVYNAALNVLKHEKVKLGFIEFVNKHGIKEENNIEHFFDREEQGYLLEEINRAIDTLPEQCREIFLLSRFGGKKSVDIARSLNISVRTVETQLYRAMKHLRSELAHLRNADILLFFLWDRVK